MFAKIDNIGEVTKWNGDMQDFRMNPAKTEKTHPFGMRKDGEGENGGEEVRAMQVQYRGETRGCVIWLERSEARDYRDAPAFRELFRRCRDAGVAVSVFIRPAE